MPRDADVMIIGAGAAGLATAIFAARSAGDRRVTILNGMGKPGAKVLLSGGGRCNITHAVVSPADYYGGSPHTIRRVLSAFTVEQTVAFFEGLGVPLRAEKDGKLFPTTNRAATVLDALLAEAQRLSVRILPHHRVTDIKVQKNEFKITTASESLTAGKVVLATGGMSYPGTGSDGSGYRLAEAIGHSIVPPTPALAPFLLEGDFHRPLSGVSQEVELTVRVHDAKPVRLRGPLLWTHFGVSGPVVLDASRVWFRARAENRPAAVSISFLPDADFQAAEHRLMDLASEHPRSLLRNILNTLLPSRVGEALLAHRGIDGNSRMAALTKESRRRLTHALIDWELTVRGEHDFDRAEVTAGGVRLDEIDARTMESRVCPGLHLTGELLDVDGRVGGFNLQWAWSSAWVCARGLLASHG